MTLTSTEALQRESRPFLQAVSQAKRKWGRGRLREKRINRRGRSREKRAGGCGPYAEDGRC